MKNPFQKNHHKVLVASLAKGTVAAAAIGYFLLTDEGAAMRKSLNRKFRDVLNDVALEIIGDKTGIQKKL